MWTPKRLLLLLLGCAVSCTAYAVYARFFGNVDGLPQLPAEYAERQLDDSFVPPPRQENIADQKLRLAFGENCPELKRTIKLEVQTRGIVLAADLFVIEPDGRVKLAPFSLALFNEDENNPANPPEINSLRSDLAYLTFDRPISNSADMGNRRIIGAELVQDRDQAKDNKRHGHVAGVSIVNNRRTLGRDDDMSLFTPGPVYYQEALKRIWTREVVQIIDMQTKPKPTTVTATGMDVYLSTDPALAKDGKPPVRHAKAPAFTGVERVVLRSDVDMHLWVDARSGFLSGGRSQPMAPAAAEVPRSLDDVERAVAEGATNHENADRSQIVITTQGPFEYDVRTDRAQFDISRHPGQRPNQISVTRQHVIGGLPGPCDQLNCDHLTLQFRRKADDSQKANAQKTDDRAVQLEIETAHATGSQVVLTSDAESLVATGNELWYDARTHTSILRGTPEMMAIKDTNEIYARELILAGLGAGKGQRATAKGPGRIEMLDQATQRKTLHASWSEALEFGYEGDLELLVLKGTGTFHDKETGQLLQADLLKVWLENGTAIAATTPSKSERRPHHIDARGHVLARAPDLHIHDTERLIVWFKDAPHLHGQLPDQVSPTNLDNAIGAEEASDQAASPVAVVSETRGQERKDTLPNRSLLTSDSMSSKSPIDLSARLVEVYIRRMDKRNELDKVWCEGTVRVRQEAVHHEERGVDIRGQTMQLTHYPEGHVLLVTGNLAEVHFDKMSILGPEINIDQKDNQVWVNGHGAMRMLSSTTFQGKQLDQPRDITIHWNRNMFFNGKDAQFFGGIQAEQDNARLACQTMQVFLNRLVSLKGGGNQGEEPTKVEKVVCDKSVRIEDSQWEEGNFVRYSRIDSHELSLDNQEGIVIAPGPGVVRIMQMGDKQTRLGDPRGAAAPQPSPPASSASAKVEQELKLTRVTYLGRMFANNNTRIAIFYDNVEVVQVPSDNPDAVIDIDRLPPDGLYMRCEQLKVYSSKDNNGVTHQQMEAHRKAIVQAREFWGRADIIKYDDSKQLIIFEGVGGNLATLYRVKNPGDRPEEIRAKKISYQRHTGQLTIEKAGRINISE